MQLAERMLSEESPRQPSPLKSPRFDERQNSYYEGGENRSENRKRNSNAPMDHREAMELARNLLAEEDAMNDRMNRNDSTRSPSGRSGRNGSNGRNRDPDAFVERMGGSGGRTKQGMKQRAQERSAANANGKRGQGSFGGGANPASGKRNGGPGGNFNGSGGANSSAGKKFGNGNGGQNDIDMSGSGNAHANPVRKSSGNDTVVTNSEAYNIISAPPAMISEAAPRRIYYG